MTDDQVVEKALQILSARLQRNAVSMSQVEDVENYLTLKYAERTEEVFGIIMLDPAYNVIAIKELFFGTVDSVSVHPRVVVKEVLQNNASNVVLFHNHPSGQLGASKSDIEVTKDIAGLLNCMDVTLLDHFIVAGNKTLSFLKEGIEL
jgi:DNA repair protein RadC